MADTFGGGQSYNPITGTWADGSAVNWRPDSGFPMQGQQAATPMAKMPLGGQMGGLGGLFGGGQGQNFLQMLMQMMQGQQQGNAAAMMGSQQAPVTSMPTIGGMPNGPLGMNGNTQWAAPIAAGPTPMAKMPTPGAPLLQPMGAAQSINPQMMMLMQMLQGGNAR